MFSLQSIIMKFQKSNVIETLKENYYWFRYAL